MKTAVVFSTVTIRSAHGKTEDVEMRLGQAKRENIWKQATGNVEESEET